MDWIFDKARFAKVLKELDEDAARIPDLARRLGLGTDTKTLEKNAEADTRRKPDAD